MHTSPAVKEVVVVVLPKIRANNVAGSTANNSKVVPVEGPML